MSNGIKQIIVIVLLAAFTVGSISVTGLLQSSEVIASSGIIVRPAQENNNETNGKLFNIIPPPPEPEIEIDVYEDQQCTRLLSSVRWGEIEAGASSNVPVYIKNTGDTSVVISLLTEGWSSKSASDNLKLSWNYDGAMLGPGEVREITLSLKVDPDCPDLDSFDFDIIIIGS